MRCYCKVKIVVILGLFFSDFIIICVLFEVGVDVFCLNMSYGIYDEQCVCYDIICCVECELGCFIVVLVDLQGLKLCVGVFVNGLYDLQNGQLFCFDLDDMFGIEICV